MTVTELDPNAAETDPQVEAILTNLRQLSAQIKEIDTELGEDKGVVAKRNELANELVSQFESDEQFNSFISKIVAAVKTSFSDTPEKLAAVYTEVHNQLGKEFGKPVKKYLDEKVAALPVIETPEISLERKGELANKRSNAVNIFKLQKEMLKYYDVTELPADIEEPSARRGAIGPRGANFTREYQLFVDDKLRTVKIDGQRANVSLSNIATTVCKELNWKTKDLKDYIIEQLGLTVTPGKTENSPGTVDPGETWEVMLPAPVSKKLSGIAVSSASAVVDESDDDEDEENDTSETSAEEDMFSGTES